MLPRLLPSKAILSTITDCLSTDRSETSPILIDNAEARFSAVLVLDASGSMQSVRQNHRPIAVKPIDELNAALAEFPSHIGDDEIVARYAELAVIRCGGGVSLVQDFIPAGSFEPPTLRAGGDTPLAEALLFAADLILDRQRQLDTWDLDCHKPFVFAVTDGQPTDSPTLLTQAASRIAQLERDKRVGFFVAVTEGCHMGRIAKLVPRRPMPLCDFNYRRMFCWFAQSIKVVSHSQVGELITLPNPEDFGWTTL